MLAVCLFVLIFNCSGVWLIRLLLGSLYVFRLIALFAFLRRLRRFWDFELVMGSGWLRAYMIRMRRRPGAIVSWVCGLLGGGPLVLMAVLMRLCVSLFRPK